MTTSSSFEKKISEILENVFGFVTLPEGANKPLLTDDGTGNNEFISFYLEQILALHNAEVATLKAENERLFENAEKWGSEVWRLEEEKKAINVTKAESSMAITIIDQENEIQSLRTERDQLKTRYDELDQERDRLERNLAERDAEVWRLQTYYDDMAKTSAGEQEKLKKEVERLQSTELLDEIHLMRVERTGLLIQMGKMKEGITKADKRILEAASAIAHNEFRFAKGMNEALNILRQETAILSSTPPSAYGETWEKAKEALKQFLVEPCGCLKGECDSCSCGESACIYCVRCPHCCWKGGCKRPDRKKPDIIKGKEALRLMQKADGRGKTHFHPIGTPNFNDGYPCNCEDGTGFETGLEGKAEGGGE